jgi:hypothetical protein
MIIASSPKLSFDLNALDTTDIHRGGMTGLWMSLKQLKKKYPHPKKFSLRKIPIVFWAMLLEVNYQAAILFLLQDPILEIFPETQEEVV